MMPADDFRERMMADVIDPIDDSWQQAGTIAATVHNEIYQIAAMLESQKVDEKDWHDEQHYMPTRVREERPEQTTEERDAQNAATLTHFARGIQYRGNRPN